MVELSEIVDKKSLKLWCERSFGETESFVDRVAEIGLRAALRVIPLGWMSFESKMALEQNLSSLPILRAALSASVAIYSQDASSIAKAGESTNAMDKLYNSGAHNSVRYSAISVTCAAAIFPAKPREAQITNAYSATEAAGISSVNYPIGSFSDRFWREVRDDCLALVSSGECKHKPLWNAEVPLKKEVDALRANSLALGENRFWIDWYEKVLTGAPQDWDLLQAIVDQVDWDGAPEEVNRQIQQIERDYLRATVRRLKEETSNVLAIEDELPSRGHNNPPEMIEDDADAKAAITFIWADLDDAEKELEKDEPDPSALKRLGDALKTGSWKVLKYLGQKADLAVDGVVKEGANSSTTWLIRALGVGYISQLEAIQSAGRALLEFAQRLFQAGGMM